MWQRALEYRLESALGQFVLSKSPVRELPDTLREEYAAGRRRALRTAPGAYLFIDTVDDP